MLHYLGNWSNLTSIPFLRTRSTNELDVIAHSIMPAHSAGANSIFIESSVSDFVAEVTVGAVVCVVL